MKQKLYRLFQGETKYICLSEFIIGIFTVCYIYSLHKLNNNLLQKFPESDIINQFQLLHYNDYQPLKYFVLAIVLVFSEIFLTMKIARKIRECEFEISDMLLNILMIAINIILIVFIINGIMIPILKAIINVMIFVYAITKVSSS